MEESEEDAIAGVLGLVPQGLAAALDGAMLADVAQAYVDAMSNADEERAAAVQRLIRQQVIPNACNGRFHPYHVCIYRLQSECDIIFITA